MEASAWKPPITTTHICEIKLSNMLRTYLLGESKLSLESYNLITEDELLGNKWVGQTKVWLLLYYYFIFLLISVIFDSSADLFNGYSALAFSCKWKFWEVWALTSNTCSGSEDLLNLFMNFEFGLFPYTRPGYSHSKMSYPFALYFYWLPVKTYHLTTKKM